MPFPVFNIVGKMPKTKERPMLGWKLLKGKNLTVKLY
jgi:hypothetical protein